MSEVDFQEDPAAASLGSGNQPALCTHADFLRMHVQESGGFFERERDPDTIETAMRFTESIPPFPSMIGFQQLHGAACRVAPDATAFPHRQPHHVVWISPVQDDPAQDEDLIRWTRECWNALAPSADGGVYVNALDDAVEDGGRLVRQAYGANYERLRALKSKYDPTNLFRQNTNIAPE